MQESMAYHEPAAAGTNTNASTTKEDEVVRVGVLVDFIEHDTGTDSNCGSDGGACGSTGLNKAAV